MISNQVYQRAPIYVPLQSQQDQAALSSSWLNYFNSLTFQLNQSLTPYGNVMPALSSADSTTVAASSAQKVIYNSTTQAFQGNINGNWETFMTVTLMSEPEVGTFAGTHDNRLQFVYDIDNDELYVVKGSTKFRLQKA